MRTREDQTTEGSFGIHTSRHNRIKLQGGGQALLRGRWGSTISFAWEVVAKMQDTNPCQTTREALSRDTKWLQTGESGRWVQQGNGPRFSRGTALGWRVWRKMPKSGRGGHRAAIHMRDRQSVSHAAKHTFRGGAMSIAYIRRPPGVGIRLIGAPPPTLPSTRRSPPSSPPGSYSPPPTFPLEMIDNATTLTSEKNLRQFQRYLSDKTLPGFRCGPLSPSVNAVTTSHIHLGDWPEVAFRMHTTVRPAKEMRFEAMQRRRPAGPGGGRQRFAGQWRSWA